MTSLLDLYVRKQHPQFSTMTDNEKEKARDMTLKSCLFKRLYSGSGYAHFKHIFGNYSGNIFTVTANNSFSIRQYDYDAYMEKIICTCAIKIAKDELIGAQYTINLENFS